MSYFSSKPSAANSEYNMTETTEETPGRMILRTDDGDNNATGEQCECQDKRHKEHIRNTMTDSVERVEGLFVGWLVA